MSTSIVPKHVYNPSGLQWFKDRGKAYSRATVAAGKYTSKAGDIIYFKSSRNKNATNNIGIVTSYLCSITDRYRKSGWCISLKTKNGLHIIKKIRKQ